MAAPVNNIAATFAAGRDFPPSTSSSAPPRRRRRRRRHRRPLWRSPPPSQPLPPAPSSASGTPNPPFPAPTAPLSSASTASPGPNPAPPRAAVVAPSSATVSLGDRLPDAALSYLDRGGAVRTVSLAELTRSGKAVIMAVPGAFAPPPRPRWWRRGGGIVASIRLSPERLVKKAGDMKAKGGGAAGTVLVACVAANDVYVMRAWGEQLGAAEGGVMMLSDPDAQMATALGMALDLRGGDEGFGVRSEGYVIVAVNGMVRALFLNHYDGGAGESATELDDVLRRL